MKKVDYISHTSSIYDDIMRKIKFDFFCKVVKNVKALLDGKILFSKNFLSKMPQIFFQFV